MAKRVHELAMHIRDEYGGEADRVGGRRGQRRVAREDRCAARLRRDEDQGVGRGPG